MAAIMVANRRQVIDEKISGQTAQPADVARRPSVHLRWALQQMRIRGWRNDDWGKLIEDDGITLGTGPICLLESVGAGMDSPTATDLESPEQFYLRDAFLASQREVPLYLNHWNDAQDDFAAIEAIMVKAIALAEADEHAGVQPWKTLTAEQMQDRWGFTAERLLEARQEQEAARET